MDASGHGDMAEEEKRDFVWHNARSAAVIMTNKTQRINLERMSYENICNNDNGVRYATVLVTDVET